MADPIDESRDALIGLIDRSIQQFMEARGELFHSLENALSGRGGDESGTELVRSGVEGLDGGATVLAFTADVSLINAGTLNSTDVVFL